MTEPVDPMASADEAEIEPTSGSVTFVGSGPGDLGLLTLAGSRAVRFADLKGVRRVGELRRPRLGGEAVQKSGKV